MSGEAERICAALAGVEGVKAATRGWPASREELPYVAVSLAEYAPVCYGDDAVYAGEAEYHVRVMADTSAEADAVASGVRAALEALGWMMTFAADADDSEVRIRAMRWKKMTA